jgi:hypothetical protein
MKTLKLDFIMRNHILQDYEYGHMYMQYLCTAHRGYCFQIHTQNYFKYFYHRPVNVYLKLQDKYNTCALSKHIGKYVYSTSACGVQWVNL